MQAPGSQRDAIPGPLLELVLISNDLVEQLISSANHELGGGGGRWRAQIGDEIRDSEVCLVADRGDDRRLTGGDGPGDRFFIEGPEILERSAAARQDDDLGPSGAAEVLDAATYLVHGSFALDESGIDPDVKAREPSRKDVQDVLDDSAGGRCHDPDAGRVGRQPALARGFEQAFKSKLFLELLKRQLKRAISARLEGFDDQLIFAAAGVHVDAAAGQHRDAVLGLEAEVARSAAETHAFELRLFIFEREVVMSARRLFAARKFAGDPEIGKLAIERPAQELGEFADREQAAYGFKAESDLLHYAPF